MLLEAAPRQLASDTEPSARATGTHVPALDGWRGIAILMVLCAHGLHTDRFLIFDPGSTGVEFFMILSGYLITTRLLATCRDETGIAFSGFYLRRAFRILPPAFLYLAVLVVLSAFVPRIRTSRLEIIASLFFWRNYALVPGWFTGHFWSLAVEEHFYLLWPVILHIAGRKRSLQVALSGAAVCAFWRWFGWTHAKAVSFSFVLDHVPYFFRTDTRVDALLIGCAVAIALSRSDWESTLRRCIRPGAAFVVVFILGAMWLAAGPWFSGVKEELVAAVLLTIILLHPATELARVFSWAPLRAVGALSYSLYIWQQLFLTPDDMGWWTRFPMSLPLLAAVAAGSYFLIEKPAIAWGARLAARGPAGISA